MNRTRFAPSTSGRAHPGTLLAALLWWLDGRQQGMHLILRWEDIDRQRCRPEHMQALRHDLHWFGIDWDAEYQQTDASARHRSSLKQLKQNHQVYSCSCSRRDLASLPRAIDGGALYQGQCRDRHDSSRGQLAWRLRCHPGSVSWQELDAGTQTIAIPGDINDPVVWRKDDTPSYHLACAIDDADQEISHIVRGQDLRWATPIQILLQQALDLPQPIYRHHPLLFEHQPTENGTIGKLAKSHGAVAVPQLAAHYQPDQLCGFLAQVIGLQDDDRPCLPEQLLADFSWDRIVTDDQVLRWDGAQLQHLGSRGEFTGDRQP